MKIQIKNIPDEVFQNIESELEGFIVPLLGMSNRKSQPVLNPVGSGTLINLFGEKCILTAGHVWKELQKYEVVHIPLTTRGLSSFHIPINYFSCRNFHDSSIPQWGPDLALLTLPDSHTPTIDAYKSYLNFEKHKSDALKENIKNESTLWVITGLVYEFSEVISDKDNKIMNANAVVRAWFSTLSEYHISDGLDFLDLGARMNLAGLPKSFEGTSGGGLWKVGIKGPNSESVVWDQTRTLCGVAFWQSDTVNDRKIIRCHGPESLYVRAWSEWGIA